MALQKEIWLNDIVEGLFADNTFAARSINHSAFVNNLTVHVPNAGAAPGVTKNRSQLPASITHRTDIDLNYQIAEYTSDPVHVPHAEEVELSYDKRNSIIRQSRAALNDTVHTDLLAAWANGATTKEATDETSIKSLFEEAKVAFDTADIPQTGRCVALEATAYNKFLTELSQFVGQSFLASADAKNGIVGRFYGFDVYMRSNLAPCTSQSKSRVALFWQEDCVSRALGATELFVNEKDATWYGDIMSALVRAGGSRVRNDKKGVLNVEMTVSGN